MMTWQILVYQITIHKKGGHIVPQNYVCADTILLLSDALISLISSFAGTNSDLSESRIDIIWFVYISQV